MPAQSFRSVGHIPLLGTKLFIPPVRPELVSRPRLIDRLQTGFDHKLTLISAPAGFGKTTLLSDCIAQCAHRMQVAWLSLDEGDNDPARFWTYVIAALRTLPELAEAAVGETLLATLRSPPPSVEGLLTGLINEVVDQTRAASAEDQTWILVLDDLHVITNGEIHEGLAFLVESLPPPPLGIHMIVAGRADPPWPLARLRARGELAELRTPDLRFTDQEVAAFLNDAMGLDLAPEDVVALEARTEGWIAGLQMAAISMRGRKRAHGAPALAGFVQSFTGSHRFVLDYLMEEVLDQQSPDLQEFLLKTSILERLTGPLCDFLLGAQDQTANESGKPALSHCQQILEQLEAANLFVVPLDDTRTWYRYHHLFADLLRSRLEQQLGQQECQRLHRRASRWYESTGLVEEAVAHAFTGKDIERAADLLEQHALPIIVGGRLSTLPRWLEALPEAQIRTRPWLCVYHAWTRYWTGRRQEVEACLHNAERILEQPTSPAAGQPQLTSSERQKLSGYVAAIRSYTALTDSDLTRARQMAQTAHDLLPPEDYMHSLASIALSATYRGTGDSTKAIKVLDASGQVAKQQGYRSLAVSIITYVGNEQATLGQLHAALSTYTEALDLATNRNGRRLLVSGFPLVKLGDLYREWNDLEAAKRYLAEGVEVCAHWGQADYEAEGYGALAHLQLAQGDREGAWATIHKADQVAGKNKVDLDVIGWLDECRLRLWLSDGNLEAATRWAQASGLRAEDELSYHTGLCHINLARVLVARGAQDPSGPDLAQGLALLDRLWATATEAQWVRPQITTQILRAEAFAAMADNDRAMSALRQAIGLGEPGGYTRIFLDQGEPLAPLLRQVLAQGGATEDAARLLTEMTKAPEPITPAPATWIVPADPLTERELEVLHLLDSRLSIPEIADELIVAVSTARTHVKNIYSKLGVHSRIEAVHQARELGIL
ncbi:MAG: LuxR C-terminal-related transcriptional regulator [Anaerolineae bacterium]